MPNDLEDISETYGAGVLVDTTPAVTAVGKKRERGDDNAAGAAAKQPRSESHPTPPLLAYLVHPPTSACQPKASPAAPQQPARSCPTAAPQQPAGGQLTSDAVRELIRQETAPLQKRVHQQEERISLLEFTVAE